MAAVTATCSLAISGILTAGAPSGGAFKVGMSFTNAGITQPQSPAVVITSQLSGSAGLAGTYQTNLLQVIASSAFTFSIFATASDALNGMAAFGAAPVLTPPLPSVYGFKPPAPLPGSSGGGGGVTSYST